LDTLIEQFVWSEVVPLEAVSVGCSLLHGILPVSPLQGYARGLDGTLDEQTVSGAALGRAGNFLSPPKNIEFFMPDEALTGASLTAFGCELRGYIQSCE